MSDSQIEKIKAKVFDFVTYSPRTVKEVETKLNVLCKRYEKYGFQPKPGFISEVVEQLKEEGFLNDPKYVENYILGLKLSNKSKSFREMTAFLSKKGIDRFEIEKINSLDVEEVEKRSLLQLVSKKTKGQDLTDPVFKNKLFGYLVRKGFTPEKIRDAVDSFTHLK